MRQRGSIVSAAPELRHSAATAASAASASHFSIALDKFLLALDAAWAAVHSSTGSEHPISFLDVLRLRALEIVECPEQGQQPFGHGRRLAQNVRRIDDHHGVELEADRPRLDVADARQEQAGEQVLVREALLELRDHHFESAVARSLLDQPHDGLDLGAKLDHLGLELGFFGPQRGDRPQVGPWSELGTQPECGSHLQKSASPESLIHRGFSFARLAVRESERRCVAPSDPVPAGGRGPAAFIIVARTRGLDSRSCGRVFGPIQPALFSAHHIPSGVTTANAESHELLRVSLLAAEAVAFTSNSARSTVLELIDLVVEGLQADPQLARGGGFVSLVFLEDRLDVFHLDVAERRACRRGPGNEARPTGLGML